jgi:hypothetical protein
VCTRTCDANHAVPTSKFADVRKDLIVSCSFGTVAQKADATCVPDGCSLAANVVIPTNGLAGSCTSNIADGTFCSLSCATGYSPAPGTSGAISCTLGTITHDAAFNCAPNACPLSGLAAPTNGGLGDCGASLDSGTSCARSCGSGYDDVGDGTVKCTLGVATLDHDFACAPKPCPIADLLSVDLPPNGVRGSCAQTLESGESCTRACHAAYTVEGSPLMECTNGVVSYDSGFTCAVRSCDALSVSLDLPAHATMGSCPESLIHQAVCQRECAAGYYTAGNPAVGCEKGDPRFDASFVCLPNKCHLSAVPLPEKALGNTCPAVLADSSSCSRACYPGYSPSGNGVISCALGTATADAAFACTPTPCDISSITAPADGTRGDCGLELASGASCAKVRGVVAAARPPRPRLTPPPPPGL